MKIERIAVAKIVTTHGIKGEVRVIPLTDNPTRYHDLSSVSITLPSGETREADVEKARPHNRGQWVFKFATVNSINQAEDLKDGLLTVSRDELIKLEKDQYFVFDIIGCQVYTKDNSYIGDVVDVLQTGANDIYVVRADGRRKDVLIPAIYEVIVSVDLKSEQIVIDPIPGLLEL